MKRNVFTIIALLCACFPVCAQLYHYPVKIDAYHFPDEAFRNVVLADFDKDGDGMLSISEANATTLNAEGKGIKDVTGIEYFDGLVHVNLSSNEITSLDKIDPWLLETLKCADNRITSLDLRSINSKDLHNLIELDCSGNQLSDLNSVFSMAQNLQKLNCSGNQMESLGGMLSSALTELKCANNRLTSLSGLMNCSALTTLDCSGNQITDLYLTYFAQLTTLDCSNNQIKALRTLPTSLTELYCANNQITDLIRITACTNLVTLDCSGNQLKKLNVSRNNLQTLRCDNNALVALDLSSQNALSTFSCKGNTRSVNLELGMTFDLNTLASDGLVLSNVVSVTGGTLSDGVITFADKQVSYRYNTGLANSDIAIVEYTLTGIPDPAEDILPIDAVYFPDEAFRSILLQADYDKNTNGYFSQGELESITRLIVNDKGIKDLSGIEYLTYVTELNVSNNELAALNLAANTELKTLNIASNRIRTLDVSNNPKLKTLYCDNNLLTALDLSGCNVSGGDLDIAVNRREVTLAAGNVLDLSAYAEEGLDVSRVTVVSGGIIREGRLYFHSNELTYKYDTKATNSRYASLTVTLSADNYDLAEDYMPIDEEHFPDANFRTVLKSPEYDVNENGKFSRAELTAVTALNVSGKEIADLTGIGYFAELTALDASKNLLDTLDVANCPKLDNLNLSENRLRTLDLSGRESLKTLNCYGNSDLRRLDISGCSSLSEINCDATSLVALDLADTQVNDFDLSSSSITREVKVSFFNQLDIDALVKDGFDLSRVQDLTGCTVEGDFIAFENETVTYKYDTTRGLMGVTLHADNYEKDGNLLPIDEEHFPDANFRNLLLTTDYDKDADGKFSREEVDAVKELSYTGTARKYIMDITGLQYFRRLEKLDLTGNRITSIDLTPYPNLTLVDMTRNRLDSIDVSCCPQLTILRCASNRITKPIDLSRNPLLTTLLVGSNSLASLDVSHNTALTYLSCESNDIDTLDVSNNKKLSNIYCGYNNLAAIDVCANTQLTILDVSNNRIAALDVSKNKVLKNLHCGDNAIRRLDLSANKQLTVLYCKNDSMVALDLSANINLRGGDMYVTSTFVNARNVILEGGNRLDLTTLADDGLVVDRMHEITGGTLDGNILTFDGETVTYKYDTQSVLSDMPLIKIELHAVNFKKDGIDDVTVDDNAPVEYYNLQGIRIDADNLTPGIYVRRSGTDSRLIVVK